MSFTRLFSLLLALMLAGCATNIIAPGPRGALALTAPAQRLVYQRGLDGTGSLPIAGTCVWPGAVIEARVTEVESASEIQKWQRVATVGADGHFAGQLKIKGGWYRLDVRTTHRRQQAFATVERVGV